MTKLEPLHDVDTAALAAWLEAQGDETWWNIDGDVQLTELLRLPCPASELAEVLRKLARKKVRVLGDASKRARVKPGPDVFDALVEDEGGARVLYLTWGDPEAVWVLAEDLGVEQALDAAKG